MGSRITSSNSAIGSRPLIISVKESRKLLGVDAKDMSDEEIKAMIYDCETLARLAIQQYLVHKSSMV